MAERSLVRKTATRSLIGAAVLTGIIEFSPLKSEFTHASVFSLPIESPGGAALVFVGSAIVYSSLTVAGHYLPKFWKLYKEDIPEYWQQ